ncbi:hypothetical protein AAFF_G00267560 [Aldrovandia affinis]|uniref:Uncharacterized protein n=1 Tax=Aldrovandia affinis TaxID=143900 RepID=A0AAD7WSK6_9TELE|nr:hypothetical protein AAFF_G00267560 [Aldrovandia affinis]
MATQAKESFCYEENVKSKAMFSISAAFGKAEQFKASPSPHFAALSAPPFGCPRVEARETQRPPVSEL